MTSRPRYVLDTNVIVSALLFPESIPGKAYFEARQRGELLLSVEAFEEISGVLRRQKFDRYVLPDERDWFVATLIRHVILVKPTGRVRVCRDPKDDKWIEIAVDGNAEFVISGDNDLLSLNPFRDVQIVTPAQFLDALAATS